MMRSAIVTSRGPMAPTWVGTTPPVLMAHLAARTAGIRIGSGGIMPPNHAPLVVAALEATVAHNPAVRLRGLELLAAAWPVSDGVRVGPVAPPG